jgi:peptidoglycan/LPS O-acetylase OafA/YrhL
MTAGLTERRARRFALDTAGTRALLAALALAIGLSAGWLAAGRLAAGRPAMLPVLAGLAVVLAAGNGYGKAYSP